MAIRRIAFSRGARAPGSRGVVTGPAGQGHASAASSVLKPGSRHLSRPGKSSATSLRGCCCRTALESFSWPQEAMEKDAARAQASG